MSSKSFGHCQDDICDSHLERNKQTHPPECVIRTRPGVNNTPGRVCLCLQYYKPYYKSVSLDLIRARRSHQRGILWISVKKFLNTSPIFTVLRIAFALILMTILNVKTLILTSIKNKIPSK